MNGNRPVRATRGDEADTRWLPADPGTYLLLLYLAAATTIDVGRLGRRSMPAGWYVYVGSALGGLRPRLRRHLRASKTRHWHVDTLREVADVVGVTIRVGRHRLECVTAEQVGQADGASLPVRRFGATDCRCPGHLFHFPSRPDLRLDRAWEVHLLSVQNVVEGEATGRA